MSDVSPAELIDKARRHPRVAHQGLFASSADLQKIRDALPKFVPFKGNSYAGGIWIFDWDHRLPSKQVTARLYLYYQGAGLEEGEQAYQERLSTVQGEDIFPEFDVSDFSGLPANESYEGDLEVGGAAPSTFRLMSEWKREIAQAEAGRAETIARASEEFQTLKAKADGQRPTGLGELEAAEWASPSETGHHRWGIEVWYLKSFNGMVGEGTALLVDLEDETVVSQRDFQFRSN